MASIGAVANGENGASVRGKLNAAIAEANKVDAKQDASDITKIDKQSPCILKTGGSTASVAAGTQVRLASGVVITCAVNTAITMPTLTAGEDYSVWVHPDGTASAVADPYSAPATAPVVGARKIGGFHYSLTAPGTTPAGGSFATTGFTNQGGNYIWDQAKVDRIAGINEFSIWDLLWHCKGEQRGMALDPEMQQWVGIYFCGTNHITSGPSRYNTDVASGTVLPKIPLAYGGDGTATYGRFSQYEAEEIANSHGLKLPSIELFRSATFGVTEEQSLGGASVTIPATARQPGYTSRIGIEQATGHIHAFTAGNSAAGGSAWITGPNRGQAYGNLWILRAGGARTDGSSSGSRCSSSHFTAWLSPWSLGLRVAGDHVIGE